MESTPAATLSGHPYTKVLAVYDAQGRRIARTIWQGGSAAVPAFKSNHRYHYDGWNVISEYSSLNLQSPISPVCSYTWGLDLSNTPQGAGGVGGLLSLSLLSSVSESSVFYPSYDGNGNITAWSQKTSTAPTARREYDAFGNTLVSEGNWPSSYGFSTKPQDAETGLYYYGYRYYDPVTGRWPSRDPIEERGGVNLYGFLRNDGANNLDLLGLASPDCIKASLEAVEQGGKLLEKMISYIPKDDALGGHKTPGSDTVPGGHYRQIKELQRGLRNKLRTAYEKCKDDDDSPDDKRPMPYRQLNELANRPIEIPPGIPALEDRDYYSITPAKPFNSDEIIILALGGAALKLVDATGKCVIVVWELATAN